MKCDNYDWDARTDQNECCESTEGMTSWKQIQKLGNQKLGSRERLEASAAFVMLAEMSIKATDELLLITAQKVYFWGVDNGCAGGNQRRIITASRPNTVDNWSECHSWRYLSKIARFSLLFTTLSWPSLSKSSSSEDDIGYGISAIENDQLFRHESL